MQIFYEVGSYVTIILVFAFFFYALGFKHAKDEFGKKLKTERKKVD